MSGWTTVVKMIIMVIMMIMKILMTIMMIIMMRSVNLGVEALICASHCSWEIVELPGGAKRGKRQLENS